MSEWIKTSERMPDDCQTVLAHDLLSILSGTPFIADYVVGFKDQLDGK